MKSLPPAVVLDLADRNPLVRLGWPWARQPLERGEQLAPIFVVGSGRSGNTLLRRILQRHPEVAIPPESYVLGKAVLAFRLAGHRSWKRQVTAILTLFERHPEFARFGLASLDPLARELWGEPPERRSLARLLDGFYRHWAAAAGKPGARWGDKTPINVFALERLRATFPRAQFIHLLRDGCDVAVSYRAAGLYPDLETAARRWKLSVRSARRFAARYPAAVHEVRYEDLVAKPEETARASCGFLGLEYVPQMVSDSAVDDMPDIKAYAHLERVGAPIDTTSIGRGRRALTDPERRLLDRLLGAALTKAGYPRP